MLHSQSVPFQLAPHFQLGSKFIHFHLIPSCVCIKEIIVPGYASHQDSIYFTHSQSSQKYICSSSDGIQTTQV